MDENLQQFREKALFNPWTRWFIGAILLFAAVPMTIGINYAITGLVLEESWWLHRIFFLGCAAFFITLALWGFHERQNDWIKVPKKNLTLRGGYFVLLASKLCVATPGRYSRKEMKNLIYLFDGMEVETSFLDERGVRHELNFRVHFSSRWPISDHATGFYRWYQELHAKMPNTDAVLEHLRENKTPLLFKIEFPINPTIPALNA